LAEHLEPGGHLLCLETSGDNPFAAAFRRTRALFRRDRDSWSISRLLRDPAIVSVAEGMHGVKLLGFDLLTPVGAVLAPWESPAVAYHGLACRLDQTVLRYRHLRRMAFKLVLHATAPEWTS
jgi:hypothetical protein